ncbi:MAG: hypothetical protein ACYC3S_07580 [Chloroflexota bacterium]
MTANTCLGTKAKVRAKVGQFFQGLSGRTAEVKQRGSAALQAQADVLGEVTSAMLSQADHVDSTLALL